MHGRNLMSLGSNWPGKIELSGGVRMELTYEQPKLWVKKNEKVKV